MRGSALVELTIALPILVAAFGLVLHMTIFCITQLLGTYATSVKTRALYLQQHVGMAPQPMEDNPLP